MSKYHRLSSWSGVIILVSAWELCVRFYEVPKWLLPAPSAILMAASRGEVNFAAHTLVTLYETLLGFFVALLVGVPLAACIVAWPAAWRAINPILAGLQAIPKNAIAPLLILWFGAGELSKVAITFLISFFPIVVNTASGLSSVDREMVNLMRSMRANGWQEFVHVRIPNSLPYLFAACKISITLSVVGAVIGEFVGADSGLGYLILVSSSQLQTDVAFVAIAILAVCGIALFAIVTVLEKHLVPWANQQSQEAVGGKTF